MPTHPRGFTGLSGGIYRQVQRLGEAQEAKSLIRELQPSDGEFLCLISIDIFSTLRIKKTALD